MSNDPLSSLPPQMPLSKAWAYYFLCLGICIVAGLVLFELDVPELLILPYFISGVALNRIVLRNLVRYHPIYNTLSNVSGTKLTAIAAWPVFYVVTLLKLAIVKYL